MSLCAPTTRGGESGQCSSVSCKQKKSSQVRAIAHPRECFQYPHKKVSTKEIYCTY